MALPTSSDLKTLVFAKNGAPFVRLASKEAINLNQLELGVSGGPFWGLGGSAPLDPPVGQDGYIAITTIIG